MNMKKINDEKENNPKNRRSARNPAQQASGHKVRLQTSILQASDAIYR
jgi:hypothetical protein